MAITASKGSSYVPCPAGACAALCCDVVDLGIVESNYAGKVKKQHKIEIVWQTPELKDDGKPYLVKKRYTLSLHEKASLRKDLESWRGQAFSDEQLNGWDVEVLVGVPALINIVHNAVNGSVFANVSTIMRLPKGMVPPAADPSYVRICHRPKDAEAADSGNDAGPEPNFEDVPF